MSERPMSRVPSDDDMLEAVLRQALADLDASEHEPPPQRVVDGSLWVHDFVNADAELAALVSDTGASAAVAVRGTATIRAVTFAVDDREIEVEITPTSPRRRRISGLVAPPTVGTARVVVAGDRYECDIEADGQFIVDDVPAGTVLVMVELDGQVIRLDPFVI